MKVKMQQIKRIVSKSLVVAIIIVTLFGSNNCYAKATSSKSPNFSSAKEIENFLSRPKKNIHFIDGSYSSLKNKYICTCDNYSLKKCVRKQIIILSTVEYILKKTNLTNIWLG